MLTMHSCRCVRETAAHIHTNICRTGCSKARHGTSMPLAGVDPRTESCSTEGVAGGTPPLRRLRLARASVTLPGPT